MLKAKLAGLQQQVQAHEAVDAAAKAAPEAANEIKEAERRPSDSSHADPKAELAGALQAFAVLLTNLR